MTKKRFNNIKKKKIVKIIFFIYINIIFEVKKLNETNVKYKIYSDKIRYKGKTVLKLQLIKEYLSKISDEYKIDKEEERKRFLKFYNLAYYTNDTIIKKKLKRIFLEQLSKLTNQTINHIEEIYLSRKYNFGNNVIIINNAIFYCELLGCNKILLKQNYNDRKRLIRNNTFIEKLNITIIQNSNINCKNQNILCFYEIPYNIFFPIAIIPDVRINLIKKEILNNLCKINTEPDDLYIHIRGGDVYKGITPKYYAQPPLCFYEKIIEKLKFKKIFIISKDNSNIIIDVLTKKYINIEHNINNLEYDISLLTQAYNVVLSISSFSISIIKFNDNLKKIWEYDLLRLSEKLLFLHHHIYRYKIKYTIYTMEPSNIYISKMFIT